MSKYIEQPRFGCALAGQQTVLAIPGARPIVHAGPGCSSKATQFAGAGSGYQGDSVGGGAHISCTNSGEQEVVFGGENKLRNLIDGALKVIKGDLFVVLTGCTSDIIGDDSIQAAKDFAEEGFPIVGTETAGFKGNSYYGHHRVTEAIIEQFIGNVTPNVRKGLVNVLSVVPYQDPFWRGDLSEIKSLLEKLGLEVNILFGASSGGVSEWKDIPNAEFNIVLSPWVGLETAELLKRKYKTPYIQIPIIPVGAERTAEFLRKITEYAGLDKEKTEKLIEKESKVFYNYLTSIGDFVFEFRDNLPVELYVVADSAYAIGVTDFLVNELGFIPMGIYITDDPSEKHRKNIENTFYALSDDLKDTLKFETDGGLIQEDIKKKLNGSRRAIFFGSDWEKFLAQDTGNNFAFLSLPINQKVITNETIVGFNGGAQLIGAAYNSIFNKGAGAVSRRQLDV